MYIREGRPAKAASPGPRVRITARSDKGWGAWPAAGVFMRIISDNILDGGEGRADPLAEVITAQRPDIVCLIEADNPEVVERIAARLGMDSVTGRGAKHAVALLSRWTIVESINHAGLRGTPRCLLEATVREPGGREWPVGVVHFKGGAFEADEVVREAEARVLLEVFARHRSAGRPHLLAGDFNANSPFQQIDPARCTPRTAEALTANGGRIPRRVMEQILAAGYTDILAVRLGDAAATAASFTTLHPGQRLDYILSFGVPPARMAEARIEQDRLARYASDHFPVVAEVG
jgi:endonuclease/exonuclease/phosphatase family metal-dependent hydrolase